MIHVCTYMLLLLTYYGGYIGSRASPTNVSTTEQSTTTKRGPDQIADIAIRVTVPLVVAIISSMVLVMIAVVGHQVKKRHAHSAKVIEHDGTLECEVTLGNEVLSEHVTYKWIQLPVRRNEQKSELDETTRLLTITEDYVSDRKYQCHVTYGRAKCCMPKKATSKVFTVKKKNLSAIVDENDGILECEVKSGDRLLEQNVTYEWKEIQPDGTGKPVGNTYQLLLQDNVYTADRTYRCYVNYGDGNATSRRITVEMRNLTARIEDRNGILYCQVEENDQPVRDNLSYDWVEGGTPVQGVKDKTLKLADRWALFQSAQEYTCTVTYAKGNGQIKRESQIQIQKKYIEATIKKADDGKIKCTATIDGIPGLIEKSLLKFYWHNGKTTSEPEVEWDFSERLECKCDVEYKATDWGDDVTPVKITSNSLKEFDYYAQLKAKYKILGPHDECDDSLGIVNEFCEAGFIEDDGHEETPEFDEEPKHNHGDNEIIKAPEVKDFEHLNNEIYRNPTTWLVTGLPGAGKTTFINRFSKTWATSNQQNTTLFLVRLADLKSSNEGDSALQTIIKHAILGPGSDPKINVRVEALRQLENDIELVNGERYIFALDGYDEYPKKDEKDDYINKLILRTKLERCTVVVTSRPYALKDLTSKLKHKVRSFKLARFSGMENFIKLYCRAKVENGADKAAEELIVFVKKHQMLESMCTLPLHCAMICNCFWDNHSEKLKIVTLTRLYERFVNKTINRIDIKKTGRLPIAYKNRDISKVNTLKTICKLAYEMVTDKKDVTVVDCTGAKGLGLVGVKRYYEHPDGKGLVPEYTFTHPAIKEYLAAQHLKEMSRTDTEEFTSVFQSKECNETLLEVFKFLCGMMEKEKKKDIKNTFKQVIAASSQQEYQIQCAYETQDPDVYDIVRKERPIRVIDRCHCVVNRYDFAATLQVIDLSRIMKIRFAACCFDDTEAKVLAEALPQCRELSELHLIQNNLGTVGAEHISHAIRRTPQLCVLDLSYNNICDAGAKHISEALDTSRIVELYLSANNIGVHGAITIFQHSQHLENLHLDGNDISDAGVSHILDAQRLHVLALGGSEFGIAGVEHICSAIRRLNLTQLQLKDISFQSEEIVSICRALPDAKCLRTLILSDCNFGDVEAQPISDAIMNMKHLHTLHLDGNNIDLEGAKNISRAIISRAKQMTNEFNVFLSRNPQIGTEGERLLMEANPPNLKIHF